MSKIKHALTLTAFTVISGILNYLTYPILIKHLSIEAYAEVAIYTSIWSILSIPIAGYAYAMMVESRERISHGSGERDIFPGESLRYSAYYTIFLIVSSITAYILLDLTSPLALSLLILCSSIGILGGYYLGYIQAMEFFFFIGLSALLSSVLRFILSFFVLVSPEIWVGVAPFFLSYLAVMIAYIVYGYKKKKREAPLSISPKTISTLGSDKQRLSCHTHRDIFAYVVITGVVITLQNIDVIIIKMLFTPYDVALYASVAVIVKFALVCIGILEMVMSPTLVDTRAKGIHKKYTYILIGLSLLGYVIASTLVPWLGQRVLHILKPELAASYIFWSAFATGMVSLGFYALFAKVLLARKVGIIRVSIVIILTMIGIGWSRDIEMFSLYFALVMTVLYMTTLYRVIRS